MSKVLVQLPTSAFAAHIARKKWGEGFELSNRQHHFLYKHLAYTPLNVAHSTPTSSTDTLSFFCDIKFAKKSERFLFAIGSELHDYFMFEMNVYLLGHYDGDETIIAGINSYMNKMDFTDEILDMDTIKKSFYRFRCKISETYNKSHKKVKGLKKQRPNSLSGAITYMNFVLENSEVIAPLENMNLPNISAFFKENFGFTVNELSNKKRTHVFLFYKKIFCYLLNQKFGYSYTQISRIVSMSRRQVIYNVKKVKAICMN